MSRIERLCDVESLGNEWWVIDGVLSGLSLLWGEPGNGKSFVAISMATCVATGRPWLGRHTRQGRVVYIAGEGGAEAVARRMHAALAEWGIPDEEGVPIDIITPGIDLTSGPAEALGLMSQGDSPVLIIVDTLSRCFTGDENKQEFMGGFVRSLDLMRDAYPMCCVLIIHHSNKQDEVRGSTVLLGAVDTSWKLTRVQLNPVIPTSRFMRELIPQKLRERDVDGAFHRLLMESVVCRDSEGEILRDSFGDQQTSLIVKPHPEDLARAQLVMTCGLGLIGQHTEVEYGEWRRASGLCKAEFDAALSYILSYPGQWGSIVPKEVGIFVVEKGTI